MTKMFFPNRLPSIFFATTLFCLLALSSLVRGDDLFAIAVGAHDNLVVFGPKGDRAAELPVPSVAQPVTAGTVSFQVSYGRNSDGNLAALICPSVTHPDFLHFTVLGKSVEADKAVVTLIFSQNLKRVVIKAGYGGNVRVNSHNIRPSLLSP